mmetsp:Transcript_16933/g.14402  ORF Transcript_16933/g.14402 Transcript_16933/m.14402 type:complete len:92 (-) Transcript_16933:160-435(-)
MWECNVRKSRQKEEEEQQPAMLTAVLPRRAPQSTPTLFYDLNRPVDKLRNGVVLRPLNPHEIACLRRDRMMASAAIERKVRCVMATTSSPA